MPDTMGSEWTDRDAIGDSNPLWSSIPTSPWLDRGVGRTRAGAQREGVLFSNSGNTERGTGQSGTWRWRCLARSCPGPRPKGAAASMDSAGIKVPLLEEGLGCFLNKGTRWKGRRPTGAIRESTGGSRFRRKLRKGKRKTQEARRAVAIQRQVASWLTALRLSAGCLLRCEHSQVGQGA